MRLNTRKEVIQSLSKYSKLIVSGCQRSGTTIFSQMLAQEFNFTWIDETDIANDWHEVYRLLGENGSFVLQAPALSSRIDMIPENKDCAIVWIRRPKSEVVRSMERINWGIHEAQEKRAYVKRWGYPSTQHIWDVKKDAWDTKQKPSLNVDWYEISYHSEYIEEHPLFKSKSSRVGRSWQNPKFTSHSNSLIKEDPMTANIRRHHKGG